MENISFEQIKEKAEPIFKESGVVRSALFGSAARGEMTQDSDIDILVELKKNKSLLDLVHLQLELEKIFNRKVDVITYNSIHPLLRDSILKGQKAIYGA